MIKRLINNGFKDQTRTVSFSGLDLFTSNDVNGVGKSAVLEAFKLALMGEIPGRAKNVDDILQFTSREEMNVQVIADTCRGSVIVERRFLRHAPRGEKRPVCINGIPKKYEDGSQWIRQHIGAVSISFDPFEFLNLPDAKKRQWIIAHSPESRSLSRNALYTLLLARIVENYLGSGIVHSLLISLGAESLDEFCRQSGDIKLSLLQDRLIENFQRQEPTLCDLARKSLDSAFRYWSPSHSAEESSNAMLAYLKSETLRLKNAVRDQAAALSCMGPASTDAVVTGKKRVISDCRKEAQDLSVRMEDLDKRMEKIRRLAADKIKTDERLVFLQENISRLADKFNGDMNQALRSLREQLHHKRVDPQDLQENLKQLNRQLSRWSADLQEQESRLQHLAGESKLKRDKRDTIGSSDFACPVACEIRCDTDMAPYREILARDIESLQQEEAEVRHSCEVARQKVTACQHQIDELDARLADQLRSNRAIQREIDLVQEQIEAEEKQTARARGMLKAYREECSVLESDPTPMLVEEGGMETLEDEKRALKLQMEQKQEILDECLRQQGKSEALLELKRQKKLWEQELGIVKQMVDLLGKIQREIASRIAGALETEVNDVLKLINSDYDFTLNLSGKHFEMGWNRDGKIIPFSTINAAHFVIFIVPFLAALIQRLARTREKSGLPTLKALCIEAESLTPANLAALLKGLATMKARGALDNVLVAHYHSLRDTEKLSGFQEHILEETKSPVLTAG
ncbi:MAG: hypothetical protein IIB46_04060 [Nitrospinae bacterium]|nr:hypothetical protein [Nitrospinota bacterium]